MKNTFSIDSITWNDLNMEEVYARLNSASSSVGQEYLKKTLQTLCFDKEALLRREAKVQSVSDDEALCKRWQNAFSQLGKTKKVSFLDHIFKIKELPKQTSGKHVLLIFLLLAAIAMLFVSPAIGILATVFMLALNIALYFRFRAGVEAYFQSMKYLVSMVVTAQRLLKGDFPEAFAKEQNALQTAVRTFASFKRGSFLLTNSVSGSLIDVFMDYIRMIFHVDLIKFNSMKACASAHEEEIMQLYNALGETETVLCISRYRKTLPSYCLPQFAMQSAYQAEKLQTQNVCHPLIVNPVPNSISTCKSVLLTGSNASGKSTFLKTIAINQILAQTIHTCLADTFRTRFCKVLSSMALTDNLLQQESYFIVEIKSLKRIFDEAGPAVPVMAFIDEVLRGTNTAERIAASSTLLQALSAQNTLVFAATHDIELTHLLQEVMDNYHFTEHVEGEDVRFDYLLKEGRSESRNALKLLRAYGFDAATMDAAEAMVNTLSK